MAGFVATVRLDIVRQARSGLYLIGVVGALLFGLFGRLVIPERYAGEALSGLYLLALSSTTFMFCAAQVLMDRSAGTLLALRASPLTADAYMGAKVLTLTAFSMVEAVLMYTIAFWGVSLEVLPLAGGVLGLGIMYAFIGLGLVARHNSLLAFLFPRAAVVGMVTQFPVFYVLELGPPSLYYAIPSMGPMLLMLASVRELSPGQWIYSVVVTVGSIGLAILWARRGFRHHVTLGTRS
ncbi:MAG: ABC transporter permease [Pseudomonadota bacterium]